MNTDDALAAALAAATPESLEALAEARERRRIRKLEDAVGRLLHIRDQIADIEDRLVVVRHYPPALADLERLGRRELDVVDTLRDLMLDA
jgi:hypothetical protein